MTLSVDVEVAFTTTDPFDVAPTWVSIIDDVNADDVLTSVLGGTDVAGTADVGSLSVPLYNIEGRFDLENTSSPYYPNLVADRPVRVTLDGVVVFTGHTERFDANIGIPGMARMTAIDPLGLLARHTISGIGLRNFILRRVPTPPTSYFRLGTQDGIEIFDEVTRRTRGQYHDYHTIADGLALSDPDASAEMVLGLPTFIGVHGDACPTGTTVFAILLIVNTRSLPAAATTNEIWEMDDPSGTLSLRINDVGALALQAPGITIPGPTIAVNTPTAVFVRRTSSTGWTIGAHTAASLNPTTASGTGAAFPLVPGTALHVGGGASAGGGDWDGQVDELLIWQDTDPGATVLADITRRMVRGLPTLSVSERSAYMVAEAGFDATRHATLNLDPASDPDLDGTALPSGDILGDARKLADTVGGDFFVRPDGVMVHRGFRIPSDSTPASVTFDDTPGSTDIPYDNLVVLRTFTDTKGVARANDGETSGEAWSADTTAPAAARAVDAYPLALSTPVFRRMAVLAQRILRKLALGSPRISFRVQLDMLTPTQRAAVQPHLVRGTRIALVNHPRGGAAVTYWAEIIRVAHSISIDGVFVDIQTQPIRIAYPTYFRSTNQSDRNVSDGLTDIVPLSPRFDSDGHSDALSIFTKINLLRGAVDTDESVYLVGGSVYWDEDAAGVRYQQIDDGVSGQHWAVATDQGSGVTTNGNVLGAVTLVRQSDVNSVRSTVRQTSGSLLRYRGSGFPATNDAFSPDLWGVRLPTGAHSCRLTRSTAQNMPASGTTVALSYDTERWDPAGLHDPVNPRRITPARTGLHLLGVNVAIDASAAGSRRLSIHPNGSVTPRGMQIQQGVAGEFACLTCVSLENVTSLAGNPYFESWCVQFSGSGLDVAKADFFSPEFWCIECSGPGARMRWTGSGTNGSGSWVQTANFTTDFDTDGLKSADTFVLTEDGPWFVYASSPEFDFNGTGTRGVEIRRGLYEVVSRKLIKSATAADQSVQTGDLIEGRAGDVLRAYSWQDSGGPLGAAGVGDYAAVFACVRVSAGG